jgi:hypothetical protein
MNLAQIDWLKEIGLTLDWRAGSNVALLRFYGDAGGTFDKTNVAVGGYLSTLDRWGFWKELWETMLIQEGVEVFHPVKACSTYL